MKTTLVLPDWIAAEIKAAAMESLETAGVLLASLVTTESGEYRLLAREMHWVPSAAYLMRRSDSMKISSEGYVPALGRAETIGAMAIWFHTHPISVAIPIPSNADRDVDSSISELFKMRTGIDAYSAVIVSPAPSGFSFTGFITVGAEKSVPIDRIWVVGDRFQLVSSFSSAASIVPSRFDRSVRAFGGDVQAAIGGLKVGIVGCGGTGSSVAELLVRLGARSLLMIDPDSVSESNLTRVYGSKENDVGLPKVDIARRHLQEISSELRCDVVQSTITSQATAKLLAECDVIFGCTDDNAGRLVLSRMASYFLIPVFDCGVLLSSTADDKLSGINGRITTLVPGSACLVCRERIDLKRAAAEMLEIDERIKLENEGYAPALGRVEPAVVTFTTSVASAAVSEFLERFVGYGPDPRPNEMLIRFHEREISTNIVLPRPGHYCDPDSLILGRGMTEPFLEQIWNK